MDRSTESEIEMIAREIERLTQEGDPEVRIPDLNAYLRVLSVRLAIDLQKDPSRWG